MTVSVPKVSVILPVYNAERYLEESIDSILAQTFEDFELIAVDDGSSDGSFAILERYSKRDARVVALRQENGGVSVSCNAAIKASQGVYVARMDADDIAHPEKLAKQVAHMDAHPDMVALGTRFRLIDPEGRFLGLMDIPFDHDTIDARHAGGGGLLSICNPSVIMRGDVLRQLGGYDERFRSAHDIEVFLRLAERGRLGNLQDVLLDYRQHMGSIGHSGRGRQVHFAWEAARMAAARRGTEFTAPEPDPNGPVKSPVDTLRKWGWWALKAGNVAGARHYGRRAVMAEPLSLESWRLMVIALRGR